MSSRFVGDDARIPLRDASGLLAPSTVRKVGERPTAVNAASCRTTKSCLRARRALLARGSGAPAEPAWQSRADAATDCIARQDDELATAARRGVGASQRSVGRTGVGHLERGRRIAGHRAVGTGAAPVAEPALSEAERSDESRKTQRLTRRLIAATVLGAVVFAALAAYGDLQELGSNLRRYRWEYFIAGLGLATANYVLRFIRWQYYLATLGIPLGPHGVQVGDSARIFVAGFVMSITPAKVGEVFKSVLLQDSHGIPLARTAPIVVAERLTDLLALVLLTALGSTAMIGRAEVALVGAAVVVIVWVACAYRPVAQWVFDTLARVPFFARRERGIRDAYESLHGLLRPRVLATASAIAMVSWALECVSLLVIARGFAGAALGLLESTFAYGAPTLVGALALLPGGLGATEASMTGVLRTLTDPPLSLAVATAITILVRLATLWWAVVLGVGALIWHRSQQRRRRRRRTAE